MIVGVQALDSLVNGNEAKLSFNRIGFKKRSIKVSGYLLKAINHTAISSIGYFLCLNITVFL